MSNGHGTWRCVCELDTVHIHVNEVSNHFKELTYEAFTYCPVLYKLACV